MDVQKRIKQCDRSAKRIAHRIKTGEITISGLKAALFNLNRHIAYLEQEITKKGVAETIKHARNIISSSIVRDIINGKTQIILQQKTKPLLPKKKKYENPHIGYLEWRDKASLESDHVPGTASEQIRHSKGMKKGRKY